LKKGPSYLVESYKDEATEVFRDLNKHFRSREGINRGSYSLEEEKAHKLVAKFAEELGLDVSEDAAGNSYFHIPDLDYNSSVLLTGSHLDSQPNAGNYDGAAGVISGIIATACQREYLDSGLKPIAVAFRGEETSGWFSGYHRGHIGSRAAVGTLKEDELDAAISVIDGRSLRNHIRDLKLIPDRMLKSTLPFDLRKVKGFIELHIEQGPVLDSLSYPIGVVTGIRGNFRARNARCIGEYSHSGGVPTYLRRDAVIGAAKLIVELDRVRMKYNNDGNDMVYSTGKFHTNCKLNALSKIPGEVSFTLDIRSLDPDVLQSMEDILEKIAIHISTQNNVKFDFGRFASTMPAIMDKELIQILEQGCCELNLPYSLMLSGGGHDAVEFCHAKVPACMIFIRNQFGSHNPKESIMLDDFFDGTRLLSWALHNYGKC
jgi:N-carbamoyl-L-amino-acid hydrolase